MTLWDRLSPTGWLHPKADSKMPAAVMGSNVGGKRVICFLCLFLSNEQTCPRSPTRDIPSHLIAQTWITCSFLDLPLGRRMEVPQLEWANHLRMDASRSTWTPSLQGASGQDQRRKWTWLFFRAISMLYSDHHRQNSGKPQHQTHSEMPSAWHTTHTKQQHSFWYRRC